MGVISGIILVCGMLQLGGTDMNLTTILGAVLIAAINIAGGFLVTNRMLAIILQSQLKRNIASCWSGTRLTLTSDICLGDFGRRYATKYMFFPFPWVETHG